MRDNSSGFFFLRGEELQKTLMYAQRDDIRIENLTESAFLYKYIDILIWRLKINLFFIFELCYVKKIFKMEILISYWFYNQLKKRQACNHIYL